MSINYDEIYQTSMMSALLDGIYEGTTTFAELAQHGDFGLGTFNELDGEMVAFDGNFYHLRADATVSRVDPKQKTPFAIVTHFRSEMTYKIEHPMSSVEIEALIDKLTPSQNLFYAIRIDGKFQQVITRTVPHQKPPYPPMVEAIKLQPTFTFDHVSGTIAGFRSPHYAQGLAVAGYHLHFVNDTLTGGGHILSYTVEEGTLHIGQKNQLRIKLLETPAFLSADLSGHDLTREIAITEGV
jgi:alpha-acetolactate decarboxylase